MFRSEVCVFLGAFHLPSWFIWLMVVTVSVQSMAKIWEPFNGVSKNWHDFHMSIFVKILDTKIVWFVTTVSVQQDTIWHAVPIVISNLNQKTGVMSNKAQVWPKRHNLFADGQLWIHF